MGDFFCNALIVKSSRIYLFPLTYTRPALLQVLSLGMSGISHIVQKRRATDFEAQKEWKGWHGREAAQPLLELPDQMFHILVQACWTEKQFKFGFNRKTIVFVLCLAL